MTQTIGDSITSNIQCRFLHEHFGNIVDVSATLFTLVYLTESSPTIARCSALFRRNNADGSWRRNTGRILQCTCYVSLVSPVSLSLLETLVIFPRSANINHQGTEISQPLSVLPDLGAWEKSRFFQNDGLTECKITRFMLLPLTLLKMR